MQTIVRIIATVVILFSAGSANVARAEEGTISAEKARELKGKMVAITMKVKSARLLGQFSTAYLNSEENYKDENNISIAIQKEALEEFKKQGVDNPAEHFKGKTVKVTGTIKVTKDNAVRVYVEEAAQIAIVEAAEPQQ